MLRTPLFVRHQELGARLVEFGGFEMPVHYGSILDEARNVRAACGLFDLCHMGRIVVRGGAAEALCQKLVTNDVRKIKPGAIRYALLTNPAGGVLDDVLVYRDPARTSDFFVVVNAANREADLAWMRGHAQGLDCEFEDHTFELAMIALQGPRAEAILGPLAEADLTALGYYKWTHTAVAGIACSVSRTGYTGEDGFEIYYPVAHATTIWDAVARAGEGHGLRPTGLGARDTLRLEAGMPLYGQELSLQTNPYEAGLGWAVKLDTDFVGRDALARIKAEGAARKLVGLVTDSRRVPRHGYVVLRDGERIGQVASGSFSPVLDKNIATAFVKSEHAETGSEVRVRIRDKDEPATIRPLPFYKRGC